MAMPDPMADSFLCESRHSPEEPPKLRPAEARYGTYYLSVSRLNFGEGQSPKSLLLGTTEKARLNVAAWAIDAYVRRPRLPLRDIAAQRHGVSARERLGPFGYS
jgi:hypothetical protein